MVRLLNEDGKESEKKSESATKIEKYLESKQIPELFNKLLTQVINEKPKDIRRYIIDQLNTLKYYQTNPTMKQPTYFTSEDFETMFDAYDLSGEGDVDYPCLIQALGVAGIANPEKFLKEDFPQIKTNSRVARPQFVQIMQILFDKKGFSY